MPGTRETRLRNAMAILDLHGREASLPHIRNLILSAQVRDALEEAICAWESWVRDQLEGTVKFSSAMGDIELVRSVLVDADTKAASS